MNVTPEMFGAYLECALWSSTDILPNDEYVNLDDYDWADGEADKLWADLDDFVAHNVDALERSGLGAGQIGHDFWLTRNHHGAGFWDRGLGAVGDELTKAAQVYGEVCLYLGDDEKVYVG